MICFLKFMNVSFTEKTKQHKPRFLKVFNKGRRKKSFIFRICCYFGSIFLLVLFQNFNKNISEFLMRIYDIYDVVFI